MSFAGNVLFLVCGVVALVSAFGTVTVRSPIRAALSLLVHIVALAGLFLTLHAHLLAFLQLIVYAGAVVVLFVFVIMYVGPVPASDKPPALSLAKLFSTGAALLIMSVTTAVVARQKAFWPGIAGCPGGNAECGQFGGVDALSRALFNDGVVPFELVGVLLTVAVVGAIMVAHNPPRSSEAVKTAVDQTKPGDGAGNGENP
ncbi:MAG: NADH-quinone oxidoreductase subunit J [Planctomycetota bacterium]